MTSFLVIVTLAVVLAIPAVSLADRVVRDRYGNIVEIWRDSNGSTDIRDGYGTLKATRTYRQGETDIRDNSGELVGTEQDTDYDR